MAPDILAARRTERPFNFADMVHPMPLGFSRLQDGDTIAMGGRSWDIRFGQGHAPDHATFWSRDDDLVIGGDQLLATISPNLGVYATEPGADPVGEWLMSCTALQPFARPEQLVLPGHKLPFRGLPDRLRQMIDNHHGALARLRDHLADGPKTAADCFAPLFKRQIDAGTYGLALVEAVAHLNHLLATGAVTRHRRADGAWLYRLSS
jgi:glyoxylase-like metal-dependent hydrolase (beta-lactamase superfamily II)